MAVESIDRIVVFTGDLNYSVRTCIGDILSAFEQVSVHILLHRPERKKARLIRNQLRNLKKHGFSWIPYQSREIVSNLIHRREPTDAIRQPRPGERFKIDTLLATGRVDMTVLRSVNADAARKLMEDWHPDLGLSLAAPILKPGVFAQPRLGTINLHKGKLPDYRGMPPAFWEVKDKQPFVGCTVHKVEAALDTGAIVVEAQVPIDRFSTPNGLRVRLDALGNQLVIQAIRGLREGTATPHAQRGKSRTNTRPPLAVERKLARELRAREGTAGLKPHVKDIIFNAYSSFQSVRRHLARAPRKPDIAILLYHRVNDELRDNVTIGIDRFDEQMAYLRRNWPVVSLRSLIRDEVDYTPTH